MSESARRAVLRRLDILDTPAETAFDAMTRAAQAAFGVETALVSLIDDERQWFKSRMGLDAAETPRAHAFCAHAVERSEVMVVADARSDARFAANPLVTGAPFIRFYAGAPLTIDGVRIGTLCLLDPVAREDFGAGARVSLAAMAGAVEEMIRLRSEVAERRALMGHVATQARTLALAETLAGVGHWSLDVRSRKLEWSDEVYRIHGVQPEIFDPQLDDALQFYDDASRATLQAQVQAALCQGAPFASKATIRRASDGALRRVLSRADVHRDEAGRPSRVVGVFQDITDQETLVASVRRDRERYRLLADNATDVIATYTADGIFTFVSPSVERLIGRSPAQLLGRVTYEIIHPDDHLAVARQFRALVSSGAPSTRIEYRALNQNGGTVWVEAHPTPVFSRDGTLTGFQDVVRDVSARKQAEDEATAAAGRAERLQAKAENSEARYRLLAENASDMIARVSLSGRFRYISESCSRILGYTPEELVGRKALEFTHPEDVPRIIEEMRRYAGPETASEPIDTQFRAVRKDGGIVWLEGRPRVLFDDAGEAIEIHDVVRDVTRRRTLEAELITARDAAEAAATVKADFLANMSHEFRTPLNSILGFAGVLARRDTLPPQERRYVSLIEDAGRNLLTVVNDVLEFSKMEAGALTLDTAAVSLRSLAAGAAALMKEQAAAKGLALEMQLPEDDAVVLADEIRLRQILLNLLGNAIKFTGEGRVDLGLLTTTREGVTTARFSVRDTGIGIAPDQAERLFGRFEQADGSTSRRFGGAGLGLAICKGLVKQMGGVIRVESRLGEGACFSFQLAFPTAQAVATPSAETAEQLVSPLFRARLLVAEDVPVNQELIRLILEPHGVEIDAAVDGLAAVGRAAQGGYDLILMDVQMPEMDGLEATRRIRRMPGGAGRTPIIALTANVLPEQIALCREAGMDDHVGKPFDARRLLDAVVRWTSAATPPAGAEDNPVLAALRRQRGDTPTTI